MEDIVHSSISSLFVGTCPYVEKTPYSRIVVSKLSNKFNPNKNQFYSCTRVSHVFSKFFKFILPLMTNIYNGQSRPNA